MSVVLQGWELFTGTGLGVVGATVQVMPASLFHPNPIPASYTGVTDSSGFWQTTALPDGVYDIQVTYLGKVKWYKGDSIFSAGLQGQMFAAQAANTSLAGPTSGGSAVPAFRALVDADIPAALTGKSLQNGTCFFPDATDATKRLFFSTGSSSTGANTTIRIVSTANRTVTLPDLTDTLVSKTSTDTLTNKTLTQPVIGDFTQAGHAHAAAASGGTVAHTSLGSIGTDDHHAKAHNHATDGSGFLGTDSVAAINIVASNVTTVKIADANVTTPKIADGNVTRAKLEAAEQFPTGGMLPFAGASAPTGWLLCNGISISRTTFASLFGVIGTAYGAGDGSTTFTLPDLRGKIPVGLDSGQTEFASRGQTGGEKTHALTTAELASHNHTLTNGVATVGSTASGGSHVHLPGTLSTSDPGGHVHTVGSYSFTAAGATGQTGANGGVNFNSGSAGSHTHTVNNGQTAADSSVVQPTITSTPGGATDNTGSGTGHNNLQPYQVANYIIKF